MARDPKFMKRQKERARQEKKAEKLQRRAERKAQREEHPRDPNGEDPDLAGIVPGPQPPLWERDAQAGGEDEDADEEDERGAQG